MAGLTDWQAQILETLKCDPGLTDRELTERLRGRKIHQSWANQECRLLEGRGALRREKREDGLIGNYLAGRK